MMTAGTAGAPAAPRASSSLAGNASAVRLGEKHRNRSLGVLTGADPAFDGFIGISHRTQNIELFPAVFACVFVYRHGGISAICGRNYNTHMARRWRMPDRYELSPAESVYPTGGGTDLAFAVMVLASYFTIFSGVRSITSGKLVALIALGILYIAIGIYGYAFCVRNRSVGAIAGYFSSQLVVAAIILYLSGSIGLNAMILLPLAGHSVVLLSGINRILTNLILTVVCGALMWQFTRSWSEIWQALPVFIAAQLFIVIFTQMAVSEEKARLEVQSLVRDLENANEQLRNYARQAEFLAVAQERNRLAREIHDGLGHHLTALNMQLKGAQAVMDRDPGKASELVHNAEQISHNALLDVRNSVITLREGGEERIPFAERVATALSPARQSDLHVEWNYQGDLSLINAEQGLAMIRSLQECVNNTLKHAQARSVTYAVDCSKPDFIHSIYQDDGIGSENTQGGFGIPGMRERALLLDGILEITTAPGKGFKAEMWLPKGRG